MLYDNSLSNLLMFKLLKVCFFSFGYLENYYVDIQINMSYNYTMMWTLFV